MTAQQAQGGLLLITLSGPELTAEEATWLTHPRIGGVILFGVNHINTPQTHALCTAIRRVNPHLWIVTDQEGGRVQRLQADQDPLPSFSELAQTPSNIPSAVQALAAQCRALGIDASLTPMLDCLNPDNPVLVDRCFGADAAAVIEHAAPYLTAMQAAGLATVGKHFPGHGGVLMDTHLESATDDRPLAMLEREDLLPFIKLQHQLDAIMLSHVTYPCLDANLPASLSPPWFEYLRKTMSYEGVIMTDCLSMKALDRLGTPLERMHRALATDSDLIIYCHDTPTVLKALDEAPTDPSPQAQQRMAKLVSQSIQRR